MIVTNYIEWKRINEDTSDIMLSDLSKEEYDDMMQDIYDNELSDFDIVIEFWDNSHSEHSDTIHTFKFMDREKLEYKKYKDVSFVHIQSKDKMQNDDDQLLDTLGFDTGIEVDEASLVFVPNSSTIEFDDNGNGNVESYSAAHDIIAGNRKLEIHKVWHKPILTKRDMVECIRSKVFYKARVKLPEVIGEIESDIWITK
jgi:hypothetical protein